MGIQRHRDFGIGVSHNILQRFGVKPSLLQIGTERVPKNVGSNYREWAAIELLVSLPYFSHVILKMHCNFRIAVRIKKKETTDSVYHHFNFRCCSVWDCMLKCLKSFVWKGNRANTAFCFRRADEIGTVSSTAELSANVNSAVKQIHIICCKAV